MSEWEKENKMRKTKLVLKQREALSRNKNHTKQEKNRFWRKTTKKAEESLMLRTTRVRALIARFWRWWRRFFPAAVVGFVSWENCKPREYSFIFFWRMGSCWRAHSFFSHSCMCVCVIIRRCIHIATITFPCQTSSVVSSTLQISILVRLASTLHKSE